MIVTPKKSTVAQGCAEALNDPALDGYNGLQIDAGALPVNALNSAKNRGQDVPDAVNDISFGIRCNGLVQCYPTARLAGEVESQDSLHGLTPTRLG